MNADRSSKKRVETRFKFVIAILIGVAVGAGIAFWNTARSQPEYEPLNADHLASSSTLRPDPKWRPSDVVRIQLEALEKAGTDPTGFELCYRFASAGNRAAVGSVDNFKAMVSALYGTLVGSKSRLIGDEIVDDDHATVLASCIGKNGQVTCYRFILTKSTEDSIPNCWLTDSVIVITDVPTPPKVSPETKSAWLAESTKGLVG